MYQPYYDEVTRFSAEGELALELQKAKAEFRQRTGDMFETDQSFERRIAAFLEWYILDRKLSFRPELTPVELFVLQKGAALSDTDRNRYAGLTQTSLSLFEFRGAKDQELKLRDLLAGQKLTIHERRHQAGLEVGDIIDARIVPYDGLVLMSDIYFCYPRDAKKELQSAAKIFRKQNPSPPDPCARVAFVHRAAYLANKSERYKHVKPRQIFAELIDK